MLKFHSCYLLAHKKFEVQMTDNYDTPIHQSTDLQKLE